MALSNGDKAICMEIAREIVEKSLQNHIKYCPIKSFINERKALFYGICLGLGFGSGIGGGGAFWALMKVFT